VRNNKTKWINK